jgi:hypothetical protein
MEPKSKNKYQASELTIPPLGKRIGNEYSSYNPDRSDRISQSRQPGPRNNVSIHQATATKKTIKTILYTYKDIPPEGHQTSTSPRYYLPLIPTHE